MTDFLDRWVQSSDANAKLVAQETLIAEAAEALWGALERAGINKSELAERLGTTKGYVSQILSGSRNMTLRTLSDICFVLGAKPHVALDIESDEGWRLVEEGAAAFVPRRRHLRLATDNGVVLPSADWCEAA